MSAARQTRVRSPPKRNRSDEDRRAIHLQLMPSAQALAEGIPHIAPQMPNTRLRHFGKSELDGLKRLLSKFIGEDTDD